jgi:nucleoside-diphosphate-sugar epimerase
MSPERYVVRVERATGRELPGPIAPAELLIHAHRDRRPMELVTQFLASRLVELTGSDWIARLSIEGLRNLASPLAATLGIATGHAFRFRPASALSEEQAKARIAGLRREAREALAAQGRNPRLRVLLTGATGFIGGEILAQAARDPHVQEVVCVVRRERVRDAKSNRVIATRGARERGASLLRRLAIRRPASRKFRFVEGDVERPDFALGARELARLERTLTHVVHCAASVSFDESYESSFRANVLGAQNALRLALRLQSRSGSPFVAHVAVETSYVHGRAGDVLAREGSLAFPLHYYNNYYELTKAMASIETERALLGPGLRVTQLLPSIVVGDARTGNNRGDSKVVNAPVNAFGRLKQALDALAPSGLQERVRSLAIAAVAGAFPADRSATLNLVPVDRVVEGVLAALGEPEAVGSRIHLASDRRIRSDQIAGVLREELGVKVRRADPTLARNLTLPLVKRLLSALGEHKLANALERLSSVLGAYSEWGQPVHGVGNDVRILGLPGRRPDGVKVFRMLCRHNRYVLRFGAVKEPGAVARRERAWREAIDEIEFRAGRPAAAQPHAQFVQMMEEQLDLETFEPRARR